MGWISTTGRYLGIVTCSALLLVSVTLGQSSRVSPPRSFPPAAASAAVDQSQSSTPGEASEQPASAGTSSGNPSSSTSNPPDKQQEALTENEPESGLPPISPSSGAPLAGTGFAVPDHDGVRFNKATPVRMAPVLIQIPEIWVDARISTVGVTPEGEMEAPSDFWEVGWYRYGTRPGDPGKSVMAGHYDSYDGAAVFYFLGDLEPGDEIRILLGGPDGERFYRVTEVATYHVDDAPLDRIFGPSDTPELILITCGGEWRGADAGGYTDRIVVYSELIVPDEPTDPASLPVTG